jgi:hypothetical protein
VLFKTINYNQNNQIKSNQSNQPSQTHQIKSNQRKINQTQQNQIDRIKFNQLKSINFNQSNQHQINQKTKSNQLKQIKSIKLHINPSNQQIRYTIIISLLLFSLSLCVSYGHLRQGGQVAAVDAQKRVGAVEAVRTQQRAVPAGKTLSTHKQHRIEVL